MPVYRLTYRADLGRKPEIIEADTLTVEDTGNVVLRKIVLVIGLPREVVVRRLRGADLVSVDLVSVDQVSVDQVQDGSGSGVRDRAGP